MSEVKTQYTNMSTPELVDQFTKWHSAQSNAKKIVDKIKAELQRRGLQNLEDKNLKTVQYFGSTKNYALVQKTEKVEVVDYLTIKTILNNVLNNHVTQSKSIEYDMSKEFRDGVSALFTESYETREVKEILQEMNLNKSQIELVEKKLAGTYVKDKDLLESVGVKEDIDIYLYFIHQAMNYKKILDILISAGYEKAEIPLVITKLKKTVIVTNNTRIGCNYSK